MAGARVVGETTHQRQRPEGWLGSERVCQSKAAGQEGQEVQMRFTHGTSGARLGLLLQGAMEKGAWKRGMARLGRGKSDTP